LSFSLTDIERHPLENGLTVLSRENHSAPIVTTMIWYRHGSRHEVPGQTGAAHFLEHMMFKGTKRFGKGEIDYITTRNGGFNNAFTSFDYTAYYFSFASDRWLPSLEIEADRMVNNHFDPEEFELERQVILEESRMEMDRPWEILRQAVARSAFERHPYRYPVIGLPEDVAALSIPTICQHYADYYVPANATLVIVGDFDTGKALDQVNDLFGPLAGGTPPQSFDLPVEIPLKRVSIDVEHPTTIPRLIFGLPAPSVHDNQLFAFHLLDKLLTEGKLSRLFQRLIEKERLASMVTSEISENMDPFLLMIRVDVREQSGVEKTQSALLEELTRMAQNGPTSEELSRAKRQCTAHHLNDLETTSEQAFNIGLYETLNQLDILTEYCNRIEEVRLEEISEAANRFLDPEKVIVSRMLPADRTR
jgi:zinc protease